MERTQKYDIFTQKVCVTLTLSGLDQFLSSQISYDLEAMI